MVSSPNSKNNSKLSAEYLIQQLTQLAHQKNIESWCLAYSGGVDSQVLLHLLQLTKFSVNAVYIDHGLQAQSANWAEHCKQQCQQYNIPFQIINVNAKASRGESPEAAARTARYNALKKQLDKNSCLLTAQHLDDQSETILLQLLRGAGAAGLAGMPEVASFSEGFHARPLLNISQQEILDYAKQNNLSWVEDPSNQQVNYDRNYLRHSITPVLKKRWPALDTTLSVFAQQQAENSQLLDVLAEKDLDDACLETTCLDIKYLNALTDARLRNALRFWFKTNLKPMPSRAVLAQIVSQIKNISHESSLLVSWANVEVRSFRNKLYCLNKINHDASEKYDWHNLNEDLVLPSIGNKLTLNKPIAIDESIYALDEKILNEKVSVRFRQGGEKIKPAGRNGSHDLKSLFQEAAVPPWQRNRIPLMYIDDKLIAVVGYWLADDCCIKGAGVLPVLS